MTDTPVVATTDDARLSMSEAIKALTASEAPKDADAGQAEQEQAQEDDAVDDAELDESEENDEGEPDPDEGQAEEDDDDAEPETESGRYVAHNGRVKLPDGTESTVAELISGNLKDRDYRQKTMAHAEEVKAFRAQSEAVQQREAQLAERLNYAETLVKAIIPEEPDPALLQNDPMAYMSQKASYDAWQKHLAFIDQERQQTAEKAKSETEAQATKRLNEEWERALEKLPELKDDARLTAFGRDLLKYGAEYGYTPQEISRAPHDHRNLVVLNKAIAWDKLQARKAANPPAKSSEGRPPVLKGSKRQDPAAARTRGFTAAKERLNREPTLKNGVAAILALDQKR